MRFLRLWLCGHKLIFWFVDTDAETGRDCKGMADPFDSGFPIGGENALLAHDFAVQSLVCYTFCDRCRWKRGGLAEHSISSGGRTGGFWRTTALKNRICPSGKIRLFGCRWCSEAEGIGKKSSERSCITGGAKGISSPRPAAATCFVFNMECSYMEKRNPHNTTKAAPAWHHPTPGLPIFSLCPW